MWRDEVYAYASNTWSQAERKKKKEQMGQMGENGLAWDRRHVWHFIFMWGKLRWTDYLFGCRIIFYINLFCLFDLILFSHSECATFRSILQNRYTPLWRKYWRFTFICTSVVLPCTYFCHPQSTLTKQQTFLTYSRACSLDMSHCSSAWFFFLKLLAPPTWPRA